MEMKNILIFSKNCFPISATFIYRQITGSIPHFNIYLAAFSYQNGDKFSLEGVRDRIKLNTYEGVFDRLLTLGSRKIFSGARRISLFTRRRLIQFARNNSIDLIHVHYGTWAVELLPIALALKLPLIVSFHGYDASKALKDAVYKKKLAGLFAYASQIIIVSEHMRTALGLNIWNDKVSLIPYGVDIQKFNSPSVVRSGAGIKILSSSRIVPKKGVPDLIAVFSTLSKTFNNISLHILGDGDELASCRSMVDRLGISDLVSFYGAQPEQKVIELMHACDIFVLNSRTATDGDMEGLPNAILEAMSTKMAVVSTFHAGIPTAVENGVSGILVPEKDNQSLQLALTKLIEDPDLVKRLGDQARRRIEQHFTIEKMRGSINSLYEKILVRQVSPTRV